MLLLESEEEVDAAVEGRVGLRSTACLTAGHLTAAGAFSDGAADRGDVDGEGESQPQPEVARDVHGGRNLRAHHESVLGTLADELHVLELTGTVADGAVEGRGVAVGLEAYQRTRVEAPEVALAARIFELDARRPAEGEGARVAVFAALGDEGFECEVDGDHGAGVTELAADRETGGGSAIHHERAHSEDQTVAGGRGRLQVGDETVVHVQLNRLLGLLQGVDALLQLRSAVRRVPAARGSGRLDDGGLLDRDDHGLVVSRAGGRGVAEGSVRGDRDRGRADPHTAGGGAIRGAGQRAAPLLRVGEAGRPTSRSSEAPAIVDADANLDDIPRLDDGGHAGVLVGLHPPQRILGEGLGRGEGGGGDNGGDDEERERVAHDDEPFLGTPVEE